MENFESTNFCPITITLKVIGGKWKVIILHHLQNGTKRFNEIKRLIPGISQKVLTAALKELEKDGIISRTVIDETPPKVEYSLTDKGNSLRPILKSMCEWGEEYRFLVQM